MIEIKSPLIQELLAGVTHKSLLIVLKARFGTVPPDISTAIQSILDEAKLDDLLTWSARCPDLESFRARLKS